MSITLLPVDQFWADQCLAEENASGLSLLSLFIAEIWPANEITFDDAQWKSKSPTEKNQQKTTLHTEFPEEDFLDCLCHQHTEKLTITDYCTGTLSYIDTASQQTPSDSAQTSSLQSRLSSVSTISCGTICPSHSFAPDRRKSAVDLNASLFPFL